MLDKQHPLLVLRIAHLLEALRLRDALRRTLGRYGTLLGKDAVRRRLLLAVLAPSVMLIPKLHVRLKPLFQIRFYHPRSRPRRLALPFSSYCSVALYDNGVAARRDVACDGRSGLLLVATTSLRWHDERRRGHDALAGGRGGQGVN